MATIAACAMAVLLLLGPSPAATKQQQEPSTPPPCISPATSRVRAALHEWKRIAIFASPPTGPGPTSGVLCEPLGRGLVVAGIDLNHADIAGHLPASLPLGLPADLTIVRLSSNRFTGVRRLHRLRELDLSNNLLVGKFPEGLLQLRSLKHINISGNAFDHQTDPVADDTSSPAAHEVDDELRRGRLAPPAPEAAPPRHGRSP